MNAQEFAYWLQGFSEMNPELEQPTPDQWKMIKEHLALVFTKVTPPLRETNKDKLQPGVSPSMPPSYPPDYRPSPVPILPSSPGTPWWEPPYKVTCTGLQGLTVC